MNIEMPERKESEAPLKPEVVQTLIEKILEAVTGKEQSVDSLGKEWSVNIDGKLLHFIVEGDSVKQVPVPKNS